MYLQPGDLRADDVLSLRVIDGDVADFFRRFAKSVLFVAILGARYNFSFVLK